MSNKLFPLSIIILTQKNDQTFLRAMKSAKWSDDVIVVDSSPKNNWEEMKKLHHCSIVKCGNVEDFSFVRNGAMKRAKNDWVLFLDSDEVIPEELKEEIQETLFLTNFDGFHIQRNDIFLQKTLHHGEVGSVKLLRLMKKNSGQWQGKVHEEFVIQQGKMGKLHSPLLHDPHQSTHSFVSKVNWYSTLRADELYQQQMHFSFIELFLKPGGKFLMNYFLKLGFLDGWRGLIYASVMSLHSLVVRIKLYEKERIENLES